MSEETTANSIALLNAPSDLAVYAPQGVLAPLPRSILHMTEEQFGRLQTLAKYIAKSQLAFVKNGSNPLTEGDIMMIFLEGLSLGLTEMAALKSIDLIKGKPALDPQGMLALCYNSNELEDIQFDANDERCIVTVKRKGKSPHTTRFGVEEATRYQTTEWRNGQQVNISLMESRNYKIQPKVMFQWRALAANLRVTFSDKILGLYTQEELGADVNVDESGRMTIIAPPPQPATPKAQQPPAPDKKPASPPPPDEKPAPHWLEDQIAKNKIAYLLKDLGLVGDNMDLWMPKIQPQNPITKLGDTTLNEEQLVARLRQIAAEINKPASTKTKPAGEGWTEDNALQLIDNLWYGLRQVGQDIEKSLGADYKQKFPNPAAAWNAHVNTCVLQRVPMYAVRAKYVESETTVRGKKQKQTYIELLTPQPVRAYGRSTTFKAWVGDEFYTEWGIDQWQPGNEYEIGEVCVQYEAKQGYLNATLVSPLPPEEDVDFAEEPPVEESDLNAFFA